VWLGGCGEEVWLGGCGEEVWLGGSGEEVMAGGYGEAEASLLVMKVRDVLEGAGDQIFR